MYDDYVSLRGRFKKGSGRELTKINEYTLQLIHITRKENKKPNREKKYLYSIVTTGNFF